MPESKSGALTNLATPQNCCNAFTASPFKAVLHRSCYPARRRSFLRAADGHQRRMQQIPASLPASAPTASPALFRLARVSRTVQTHKHPTRTSAPLARRLPRQGAGSRVPPPRNSARLQAADHCDQKVVAEQRPQQSPLFCKVRLFRVNSGAAKTSGVGTDTPGATTT